jgi:hypothetical protein
VAAKPKPRKPAEVQADIERALAQERDDRALRSRLEALTLEPGFHGVASTVWAPALYRRNRVLFRPFILSHLSTHLSYREWRFIDWKGSVAKLMDPWLDEVDRDGDVALFRVLYAWKLGLSRWPRPKDAETRWREELQARLRAASTRAERQLVLSRFDLAASLDQATAIEVHKLEPVGARRFVMGHLPFKWSFSGEKRALWKDLRATLERGGDKDFALELYRRQVPVKEWREDVKALCRAIASPAELCEALEKHHPQGWLSGVGNGLHDALEARGRDVFPYVVRHLKDLWRSWLGRDSYHAVLSLSQRNEWHDLWAETLRTCGNQAEFDQAVMDLLAGPLSDEDTLQRLTLLAGVSRELNFGPLGLAQVHPLEDATAVTLYKRFPALLRGPFKMHVGDRWSKAYPELVDIARAAGDAELLDYLASRTAIRLQMVGDRRQIQTLSEYYEALPPEEFGRRAAAVLTQVPAFSIPMYRELIRTNRLARLLFERAGEAVLEDPHTVRDLLEAPEIHVQALAFRALGRDDPRARERAAANLDLLEATLLRPLHRKTRRLAFAVLGNAVGTLEGAKRVLQRAREALDLPDKRYDKEALVGLIGRILHQWPELRGKRERPQVFRAGAA